MAYMHELSLNFFFQYSFLQLYPELGNFPVAITEATQAKYGDYQFNSSMSISQVW